MGAWRGREAGAKGSTGLKGGWGGRQPTAEGSMGFDPQATTFLSPPGGIYLISHIITKNRPPLAK